jgi:hypothetical protein
MLTHALMSSSSLGKPWRKVEGETANKIPRECKTQAVVLIDLKSWQVGSVWRMSLDLASHATFFPSNTTITIRICPIGIARFTKGFGLA